MVTTTSEIYTLSLHDALPIWLRTASAGKGYTHGIPQIAGHCIGEPKIMEAQANSSPQVTVGDYGRRSEEHTSELQSLTNLVCRLLLEKKQQPSHASADSVQPL